MYHIAIRHIPVRIILIRRATRACDGVFVIWIVTVIRRRAVLHARLHVAERIVGPRAIVLVAARRHAGAEQAIQIIIRVIRRLAARVVLDGQDVVLTRHHIELLSSRGVCDDASPVSEVHTC